MPNRIIKESICVSESIDSLTPEEESFCYRLIVNADDFGRFYADPVLLRARLYPRRMEKTKLTDISKWLFALADKAKMIVLYINSNKPYLQFVNWEDHQQKRANKSKFPAPDEEGSQLIAIDSNGNQSQANVPVNVFVNEKRKRETKSEPKTSFADNVLLKNEEYQKLVQAHGEPAVKRMIELLDNYKGANGKKYASDYKAILNWVVDRYNEEQAKKGIKSAATNQATNPDQAWQEVMNNIKQSLASDAYKMVWSNPKIKEAAYSVTLLRLFSPKESEESKKAAFIKAYGGANANFG